MRHFYSAVLVALVITAGVSGCDILGFHNWSWSQKLTITVNTPDGPKTASSVVVVDWEKTPAFLKGLGGGGYSGRLTGNVVVLEVAPSKYLLSLFDSRYGAGTALTVFFPPKGRLQNAQPTEEAFVSLQQGSQLQALSPDYYPNFVTFRDINDPASVERVSPGDFEQVFGHGTTLASVTLSITDEKRTYTDFAQIFPWWDNYKRNKQLDGDRYTYLYSTNRFANSLNSTNFTRD